MQPRNVWRNFSEVIGRWFLIFGPENEISFLIRKFLIQRLGCTFNQNINSCCCCFFIKNGHRWEKTGRLRSVTANCSVSMFLLAPRRFLHHFMAGSWRSVWQMQRRASVQDRSVQDRYPSRSLAFQVLVQLGRWIASERCFCCCWQSTALFWISVPGAVGQVGYISEVILCYCGGWWCPREKKNCLSLLIGATHFAQKVLLWRRDVWYRCDRTLSFSTFRIRLDLGFLQWNWARLKNM